MAAKHNTPTKPQPGTYELPPGWRWVRKPGVSTSTHVLLGVGGLFTFGITWIVWILVMICTPSYKVVAEQIPVVYTAPVSVAQAGQLPPNLPVQQPAQSVQEAPTQTGPAITEWQ